MDDTDPGDTTEDDPDDRSDGSAGDGKFPAAIDRFALEIGTGTVAHVIDVGTDVSEMDEEELHPRPDDRDQPLTIEELIEASPPPKPPGEKLCSRGNRHLRDRRVPLVAALAEIDEPISFEADADPPEGICSYCWSALAETIETIEARAEAGIDDRIGSVGYRLRWKQQGRARKEWYDIVVRPETTMAELDRLVCRFTTLDDLHLRMYGLENEYLDSSLQILPDHMYESVGDPDDRRASAVTIADVAEAGQLWEGDRLSLVYDFGTPSHFYCIVKDVYEPSEIDRLREEEAIAGTETAAIVDEKRP